MAAVPSLLSDLAETRRPNLPLAIRRFRATGSGTTGDHVRRSQQVEWCEGLWRAPSWRLHSISCRRRQATHGVATEATDSTGTTDSTATAASSWSDPLSGGVRGGGTTRPTTILRRRSSCSQRRLSWRTARRSRTGTTVPAPERTIRLLQRAQRCGSRSHRGHSKLESLGSGDRRVEAARCVGHNTRIGRIAEAST
jgi:hypothetical protein